MLTENSPLLNLPVNMDPKQAVFIDGIRHAAQIIEMAYSRICDSLTKLSFESSTGKHKAEYTHVLLDVWAFIDTTDLCGYCNQTLIPFLKNFLKKR